MSSTPDSLLPPPVDIAAGSEEAKSPDWCLEDVAGVLLGLTVLALIVLLAVAASVNVATALLRHL